MKKKKEFPKVAPPSFVSEVYARWEVGEVVDRRRSQIVQIKPKRSLPSDDGGGRPDGKSGFAASEA